MDSRYNSLSRILPTTYSLKADPSYRRVGTPKDDDLVRRGILLYQAKNLVEYGLSKKVSEAKKMILSNTLYRKYMNVVMRDYRKDQKKRARILNSFWINRDISYYNECYLENAREQFINRYCPFIWEHVVSEQFELPTIPKV